MTVTKLVVAIGISLIEGCCWAKCY